MPLPRLTCLFHDSTTVVSFLNTEPGRGLAGDLLVECSHLPAISFLLNLETPANYPGVAGLLGGTDIGTLAHPSDRLPAPILLAPGTPVSPMAIRDSLRILARADERLEKVTLLVRLGEARAYGTALAIAERFAVAWDVGTAPGEELVEFGRWLANERLITATNFAGLFPYVGGTLDAAHSRRLATTLAPIASRLPHLRTGIVATPA